MGCVIVIRTPPSVSIWIMQLKDTETARLFLAKISIAIYTPHRSLQHKVDWQGLSWFQLLKN